MGTIITSILKGRQPEMVLLMIGFADSGKTTILYQLKYGEKLNTAPTIGFNMETITIRGKEMTIWDLGGQPSIRKFWATYYNGKNGIIFVIDVTDADKISQTEVEFRELIKSR
jgi:small GTP-binding protein